MQKEKSTLACPIGIMDSGVGGVSVLYEAMCALPGEDFLYMADEANVPYGDKTEQEILLLVQQAAEAMRRRGIKALVIACNTATSAAARALRQEWDIPVIGMEPALKPAVMAHSGKMVAVMATKATLHQEKFRALLGRYGAEAEVRLIPGPGLAELVENSASDDVLQAYLRDAIPIEVRENAVSVVLGCTHYLFARRAIRAVFQKDVTMFDGNAGTVRQLARLLEEGGLLRKEVRQGTVAWMNTLAGEAAIEKLRRFLERAGDLG